MGIEFIFSGFIVGLLVGLTGVGGGSLMTPLLVLIFKFPTAIAIGTDLLYASITKSAGVFTHSRLGNIEWSIVRNLMLGSIPASFIMTYYLKGIDLFAYENVKIINVSLGIALVLTSFAVLLQPIISKKTVNKKTRSPVNTKILTILLGFSLGILVTLTSVGAGAMGVTALLLLYPNMSIKKIVGTDIAHAVPLTLFAGLGHLNLGTVNGYLLLSLLIGSIPGVSLGSHLSAKIDEKWLRYILAIILIIVGIQLIR
ncbi:sulfite exporter TauE/SafE family protein [Methylophilaceae bacterium]|jgi:uncharacterized membrane protein YfcA|nr:sulfite exporter TauE/SafE family protein [Methylophilaceae bacterium]|tara:strand:+ start:1671 stop:2438 length:768 start_codon:yes stop_codon:yes gene_type:complete